MTYAATNEHGLSVVMRGLVPRIHVLMSLATKKDVDGRDRPGHDVLRDRVERLTPR